LGENKIFAGGAGGDLVLCRWNWGRPRSRQGVLGEVERFRGIDAGLAYNKQ